MTKEEEFVKLWDEKIKPLAIRCCKIENQVDTGARYYIGDMIGSVEHDIADGRILGLGGINTFMQVKGTLNDDEYYTNVHHDKDNNETKLLKEFGNIMNEGFDILTSKE